MKKTFLISIFVILLLALATYFLFTKENINSELPKEVEKPVVVMPVEIAIPESDEIDIQTNTGNVVRVKNFLKTKDAVTDSQNPGYYYLGNTFPDTEQAVTPSYIITYIYETQYFNVTLLKEPLRYSRLEAETYIKQTLGVEEYEICNLNYTVSVPAYVNEQSSGLDFRFSFCAGSTSL